MKMGFQKGTLIATSMIAFSTSLGVLIALLNFLYQIRNLNLLELFLYAIIYIDAHLLFLYIIKRLLVNET